MCILCRGKKIPETTTELFICQFTTDKDLQRLVNHPNLRVLVCMNFFLGMIPVIPGLQELDCSYNRGLKTVPIIPGLQKLHCYSCPNLKAIPVIPGLKELFCWSCPNLKILPVIPGLQVLNCQSSGLETIPVIPELHTLFCSNCENLKSIPLLPNLRILEGEGCSGLKDFPMFFFKSPFYCPKSVRGLLQLQRLVRRYLRDKHRIRRILLREYMSRDTFSLIN